MMAKDNNRLHSRQLEVPETVFHRIPGKPFPASTLMEMSPTIWEPSIDVRIDSTGIGYPKHSYRNQSHSRAREPVIGYTIIGQSLPQSIDRITVTIEMDDRNPAYHRMGMSSSDSLSD
jgi:hypothetical protein